MPMNEEVRNILSSWETMTIDHEPEGWPAVRMRELTTIRAELTRLTEIADSVDPLVVQLEAANALLRDIKEWDVNAAQGTCLMVPHSLRSRIQAHLSEPRT